MAYTIRTTEEDEKNLKILMETLKVGSVSKALLLAAKELPKALETIEDIRDQLERNMNKLSAIRKAKYKLKHAEMRLKKLLK
jgi:DNA polymerase III delta prime subunit